jgi:hypothetical protein
LHDLFLCVCGAEVAEAEALDGGEDVVGGFGPAERFWIGLTVSM